MRGDGRMFQHEGTGTLRGWRYASIRGIVPKRCCNFRVAVPNRSNAAGRQCAWIHARDVCSRVSSVASRRCDAKMFASWKISRASMLHPLLTPDVPARAGGRRIVRSDTVTSCQRNDPLRRIYFGVTHFYRPRSDPFGTLECARARSPSQTGACERRPTAKLTSQDFGWL